MSEETLTVRQVRYNSQVYDIEAPKLVEGNKYTTAGYNIVNSTESAIIYFNFDETANTGGLIEFNSKGNLAVESLTKHVNIEAKKGIQLKPTTNIIFDSSRRIFNNKGNEVHLEFVFDDYDESSTGIYDGDDEAYAKLNIEARSIDLRCFDHGGIALQPCGKDSNNHENKIKFESSRTSEILDEGTYSNEGGKGMEFGTFNNLHSSLFTLDYRFNKKGLVYAATRGPVSTVSGKTDYPTQDDDFKDILDDKKASTWNEIVAAGKESTFVVSKSGKVNPFKGTVVNNMHKPIYIDTETGDLYLSEGDLDTVYDGEGNVVQFGPEWTKAEVYTDAAHTTLVAASSKLFLQDVNGNYWIADINSSSQLKAWGHKDHDPVAELTVITAAGIVAAGYTQISSGSIYNIDENPVMAKIKTIMQDASVDDYSKFVTAMCNAFNWV